MREIKKIKFFVNDDEKSHAIADTLIKDLLEKEFLIVYDNTYDLGISIGGDGSFLKMIRSDNFNSEAYYIGVNAGTLGFLQEIDFNDTRNFVERLASGDYKEEEINTLETTIYSHDENIRYQSLNEVVIRKSDLSVLKNKVYVDNELLENFVGDGLLVSTSTGSTAYNMSFGGSIIYNTLKAYILTPIAPINNKAYNTLTNSLIVPNEKSIILEFNNESLLLMVDGRNKIVNNVNKIEVKISNKNIKCLRMNDFHFIKVVNKKIIEK